jgi:hypothetical protein
MRAVGRRGGGIGQAVQDGTRGIYLLEQFERDSSSRKEMPERYSSIQVMPMLGGRED